MGKGIKIVKKIGLTRVPGPVSRYNARLVKLVEKDWNKEHEQIKLEDYRPYGSSVMVRHSRTKTWLRRITGMVNNLLGRLSHWLGMAR